jgi:hypothetical protein
VGIVRARELGFAERKMKPWDFFQAWVSCVYRMRAHVLRVGRDDVRWRISLGVSRFLTGPAGRFDAVGSWLDGQGQMLRVAHAWQSERLDFRVDFWLVVLDLGVGSGDPESLAQGPDEMTVIVANGKIAENAKGA